jgi:hypothetical protein
VKAKVKVNKMKVKELIKLLEAVDPEMEVLSSDNDGWYYDIYDIDEKRIKDGQAVRDQVVPMCVVLE